MREGVFYFLLGFEYCCPLSGLPRNGCTIWAGPSRVIVSITGLLQGGRGGCDDAAAVRDAAAAAASDDLRTTGRRGAKRAATHPGGF